MFVFFSKCSEKSPFQKVVLEYNISSIIRKGGIVSLKYDTDGNWKMIFLKNNDNNNNNNNNNKTGNLIYRTEIWLLL